MTKKKKEITVEKINNTIIRTQVCSFFVRLVEDKNENPYSIVGTKSYNGVASSVKRIREFENLGFLTSLWKGRGRRKQIKITDKGMEVYKGLKKLQKLVKFQKKKNQNL